MYMYIGHKMVLGMPIINELDITQKVPPILHWFINCSNLRIRESKITQ